MSRVSFALIVGSVVALTLAGCSSSYEPMVDFSRSSKSMETYKRDLAECQAFAEQRSSVRDTAIGTGAGALLGAAVGAAIGAITGSAGTGAAVGAIGGGTSGGLGTGVFENESQKNIIRNCMRNRGYAVLN